MLPTPLPHRLCLRPIHRWRAKRILAQRWTPPTGQLRWWQETRSRCQPLRARRLQRSTRINRRCPRCPPSRTRPLHELYGVNKMSPRPSLAGPSIALAHLAQCGMAPFLAPLDGFRFQGLVAPVPGFLGLATTCGAVRLQSSGSRRLTAAKNRLGRRSWLSLRNGSAMRGIGKRDAAARSGYCTGPVPIGGRNGLSARTRIAMSPNPQFAASVVENLMPTLVSDDDHQADDNQNPGEDNAVEPLGNDCTDVQQLFQDSDYLIGDKAESCDRERERPVRQICALLTVQRGRVGRRRWLRRACAPTWPSHPSACSARRGNAVRASDQCRAEWRRTSVVSAPTGAKSCGPAWCLNEMRAFNHLSMSRRVAPCHETRHTN